MQESINKFNNSDKIAMSFHVTRDLRDEFSVAVKKNDDSKARVLRHLIRNYIDGKIPAELLT